MSQPWNEPYDNDPDFDDPNDPGQNQSQGGQKSNPLRERMRKLEKENRELKEANDKYANQMRASSLETVLAGKKVRSPGKVAKLIPKDVDSTDEAIGKWLEEYGDVFAIESAEEPAPPSEENPEGQAQQQAMSRMGQATNSGSTPGKQADLAQQVANAQSREELIKLIEAQGGGFGSG